ncbi:MAG: M48 family metalloprotease [Burkholderiales bacterium]|nr:M48 family metalloprotease [Burkholderiales bacterium]
MLRNPLLSLGAGALLCAALTLAVSAQTPRLPDLGDASAAVVSPQQERRLGLEAMRELRAAGAYLQDPEVNAYLQALGNRILVANPELRERFEFFAVADPSINAFALPGGYIGVHLGLIALAQSESELAAVLAHEIAHVVQRHYARSIDEQRKNTWMTIASIAAAAVAARAGSADGVQAAILAGQAAQIQAALNFSRENEREADRVGFNLLERAHFDTGAMASLFERLQRAANLNDPGLLPSYLRTHPLTLERLAEARGRVARSAHAMAVRESEDFHYVRALVRSYLGDDRAAVEHFETALRDRRFAHEAATRYGLAAALLRSKQYARGLAVIDEIERSGVRHPMIAALRGHLLLESGEVSRAIEHFERASHAWPDHAQFFYDYPEALLRGGRPAEALAVVERLLARRGTDTRLLAIAARAAAETGQRLKQHRYLGEQYVHEGKLQAAIDQFELAAKAGDADHVEASLVEARRREIKRELEEQAAERRSRWGSR